MKANDIERWESLKSYVDGLVLRFPVAEISKSTGESKGNVSSYLNGKKPIPENFLKTLYKNYGMPSVGAQELKQKEKPGNIDYQAEFRDAMATIRGYNDFLQRMLETSLGKVLRDQEGNSGLLSELLRRDVHREAKGNPEKEKEILDEIVRRIGPKLNLDLKEGIGHDASS